MTGKVERMTESDRDILTHAETNTAKCMSHDALLLHE